MTKDLGGHPTIAVLGGGGRVGRLLVPCLRHLDVRIVVQSRHPGRGIDWVATPDERSLADWLGDNAAALTVVLWGSTSGPAERLRDNSALAIKALRAASVPGCPAVAVMSSAAVYGVARAGPFDESDPPAPSAAYGAAKAEMETAVTEQWRRLGPGAPALSLLRLANVVGADMLGQAVAAAGQGQPLLLDRFADGSGPRRSYLSPSTLARLCAALAAAPPPDGLEVLNVADGPVPVPMQGLLEALAAAGRPVPWGWRAAPPQAHQNVALRTDRITRRFPEVARRYCRSADDLVAAWLAATDASP